MRTFKIGANADSLLSFLDAFQKHLCNCGEEFLEMIDTHPLKVSSQQVGSDVTYEFMPSNELLDYAWTLGMDVSQWED